MDIRIDTEKKRKLWEIAKELPNHKHKSSLVRYKLDGRHPAIRQYEGFLGECAVAIYLDEPYMPEIYDLKGDDGYDLIHDGVKIGVKASTYHKPRLVVKVKEKKADVYYLTVINKKTGIVKIAGKMDVADIINRKPRKIHQNGPLNYVVEYDELGCVADR